MQTITEILQHLEQAKANREHGLREQARRAKVSSILATVGECEQVERMAKGGR